MLTISQLAAYAGVTVRAVRHYHQIGLLPEPERDRSGYRTYDAAAVVRLIRIHTLADAGVPLARVQELLDASAEEFANGVQEIDKKLRAEVRRLQGNRKRIAMLAAGEQLALPQSVLGYLDRLRGLGVEERYIAQERDAWIMVAAHVPHLIDAVIAKKHEDLDDPDMMRLYHLVNDDPRGEGRRGGHRWPRRPVRRPAGRDHDRVRTGRRACRGDPGGAGLEGLDPHRASACRQTQHSDVPSVIRVVTAAM
jgi:DNA-binding transcriptional MerR regulator